MNTTCAKIVTWIIAILVLIATIVFACLACYTKEFAPMGTLIILGLTLVALIFYAFYTYEIAEVNKKTYEDSKLPVVSLKIIPKPTQEFQHDTRVILQNFSNYNVEAFVNLNLKVNGNPIELKDYSGKESWFLTARQLINGHYYYIGDVLAKAGTNVKKMKGNSRPGNVRTQLRMDIDVRFRGLTREYDTAKKAVPDNSKHPTKYTDRYTKWLGNPTQKWYFNFSEDVWVYDL